jgi:PAS domain
MTFRGTIFEPVQRGTDQWRPSTSHHRPCDMISPSSSFQNISLPLKGSALPSDAEGGTNAYDIRFAEMLADAENVFQLVYSYWNALRGERTMCSRAEIDPIEMRDVLTHLILLDVTRDPFDGVFCLTGSDVEQGYGFPLTNLALSQIWASRDAFALNEYERVAAGTLPRFSTNLCENARQVRKKVSRLLCPLSADGVSVDAILGAVILENATR